MRSLSKDFPSHILQPASINYKYNYNLANEGGGNILSFHRKSKCLNVSAMTADFSKSTFQIYSPLLYSEFLYAFLFVFIKADL